MFRQVMYVDIQLPFCVCVCVCGLGTSGDANTQSNSTCMPTRQRRSKGGGGRGGATANKLFFEMPKILARATDGIVNTMGTAKEKWDSMLLVLQYNID